MYFFLISRHCVNRYSSLYACITTMYLITTARLTLTWCIGNIKYWESEVYTRAVLSLKWHDHCMCCWCGHWLGDPHDHVLPVEWPYHYAWLYVQWHRLVFKPQFSSDYINSESCSSHNTLLVYQENVCYIKHLTQSCYIHVFHPVSACVAFSVCWLCIQPSKLLHQALGKWFMSSEFLHYSLTVCKWFQQPPQQWIWNQPLLSARKTQSQEAAFYS